MSIIIAGYSNTDKVPGFVGETVFGAGRISAGSIPLVLLINGLKKSGFATGLTPDVDVVDILSEDDADTWWGPGSEGARMAYAALRVPGVKIKGCACTPGGGAAAAVATITPTCVPTAVGTWSYRIGGVPVTGGIATTTTAVTMGAAIAAAVNANTKMPVTAAADGATGVVTLTWKSLGPRGNYGTLFQDASGFPSGVTCVVAGGSALASSKGSETGCLFHSGATAESVAAMLAVLFPSRYNRIAAAQNDVTNANLWKTQITSKAGPLEGRTEHVIFGSNDALATAETLSKTNLNNWRMQVAWLLNSETHPSELAAVLAALRVQAEQNQPNSGFDGAVLPGVAPQCSRADWAQRATQSAALDNGVTPLVTDEGGNVSVGRAITSHCLNGSDPDYRTLDTAQSVVPDYVRDDLRLLWTTGYVVANPYVRDNPSPAERDPPSGVATPNSWAAAVQGEMLALQEQQIVTAVELNPTAAEYNKTAQRIMAATPVIPLPLQHSIGQSVRQLNA